MMRKCMKRSLLVAVLISCMLLSGCSNSVNVLGSAASYIGSNHEVVLADLKESGFENITVEVIEDLASTEAALAGSVESVSIDGNLDFAENAEFPKDAAVVITYHAIKMVTPPSSSQAYAGADYETVLADLQGAGFENITANVIEDLTSTSALADGSIESISIDGNTRFTEKTEFPKDVAVVITYHAIKKIASPISSEDIQDYDYETLATMFIDAGFVDVEEKEVFDLDPDTIDVEYKNKVSISGDTSFNQQDVFPFDGKVSIVCHRPYEKYTVKMHIDFIPNLFFNKYNVDLYVDGIEEDRIAHGTDADYEFCEEYVKLEKQLTEMKVTVSELRNENEQLKKSGGQKRRSNADRGYDDAAMYADYLKTGSFTKTAKNFGCNKDTVEAHLARAGYIVSKRKK